MAVLSHHHEDHFGATKLLINEYNIPVYATKTTAFLIRPKILIPPERNLAWGTPDPCIVKELPNTKEINHLIQNNGFCQVFSNDWCENNQDLTKPEREQKLPHTHLKHGILIDHAFVKGLDDNEWSTTLRIIELNEERDELRFSDHRPIILSIERKTS